MSGHWETELNSPADTCQTLIMIHGGAMKVVRYFESLSHSKDTMFVEIDSQHRFTRRGADWEKFRRDLIELIKQTLSEELAEQFTKSTHEWVLDNSDSI